MSRGGWNHKEECYLGHKDCYDMHEAERLADESDWDLDMQIEMGECVHEVHSVRTTLIFVAHYGAPGIGAAYKCKSCDRDFAVVGGNVYDPAEGMHILGPEDVI